LGLTRFLKRWMMCVLGEKRCQAQAQILPNARLTAP